MDEGPRFPVGSENMISKLFACRACLLQPTAACAQPRALTCPHKPCQCPLDTSGLELETRACVACCMRVCGWTPRSASSGSWSIVCHNHFPFSLLQDLLQDTGQHHRGQRYPPTQGRPRLSAQPKPCSPHCFFCCADASVWLQRVFSGGVGNWMGETRGEGRRAAGEYEAAAIGEKAVGEWRARQLQAGGLLACTVLALPLMPALDAPTGGRRNTPHTHAHALHAASSTGSSAPSSACTKRPQPVPTSARALSPAGPALRPQMS